MKIWTVVLIFFGLGMSCSFAQGLKEYQWKNRIVLLSDTHNKWQNSDNAYKDLKKVRAQLLQRDVLIFFLKDGRLYNENYVPVNKKKDSDLPQTFNGYLLIGKDGGVKMKGKYPIDANAILERIDGMPMRKAEMKFNQP